MLTALLNLLEEKHGELNLAAVSKQLQAQPTAVAGMVETLVRKGRLVEVAPACGICDSCGMNSHCSIPDKRAKRYLIAKTGHFTAPES